MKLTWRISFAAFCLVVLGCGNVRGLGAEPDAGGDDGGDAGVDDGGADVLPASQCPSTPACGGDLVGTWTISSTCLDVDVSSYAADCRPFSTARAVDYKLVGTVAYNADMTYTLEATLTGRVVLDLPRYCLTPPNGMQITCDQLEAALVAPGKYESVTCVVRGAGGCICTFGLMPQPLSAEGTYTATAAGVLTEADSQGNVDLMDYCINDDATMTLSLAAAGATLAQQRVTSGSITLAKP